MNFFLKLFMANVVIILCTQIGKKLPSLAGVIATMPLTALIVLIWIYSESAGDRGVIIQYTRSAVWGIIPTALFFIVAFYCLTKQVPFLTAMLVSFGVWLFGACLHQLLLKSF